MPKTSQADYEKRIQRRFNKTLKDYPVIADGDHILVALSGGKDSLLLTELLARRSRIHRPRFQVCAVHVRMGNIPYKSSSGYLQRFCADLHVPLHIVETRFDLSTDTRKHPCFLCSWNRRKAIFRLAQSLGCNKIALGHHMDDILHTALMNVLFEGRFSSMPVILKLDKMPLTIIRPLALQFEDDIKAHAEAHRYEKQEKNCPYEQATRRADMAQLYRQMESLNPEARFSLWHALEKEGKLVETGSPKP